MSEPIRAALEKAAKALWQAESLRAAGRPRKTEWHDEGEDTRRKWRFMAAYGNAAFFCNLHGNGVTALADGNMLWLAQFLLAAAKEVKP